MDIFAYISFGIAFLFLLGSVVGVVRFKDGYQKMQAVTIATSMSMFWFALGVFLYGLYLGDLVISVKAVLVYLFMLITSAVSSNMIVRASLEAGIEMKGHINLFREDGDKQ